MNRIGLLGASRRRRAFGTFLLLLSALPGPALAAGRRPGTGSLIYLYSEVAGERGVEAENLIFVHFETTYRHRAARHSPTGETIEIVERRKECRCVRLADYSRIKMEKIREIAVSYPPGSRIARVRLTLRNGRVREYAATDLYGGDGLFPPRFAATLEGAHREFPLVLGGEPGAHWPEESLSRILLIRTEPAKR